MKMLYKLFYKEIFIVVSLITLGFLALFYFFDLINELQNINTANHFGYTLSRAFLVVLLLLPSHLYELLPISVLIGFVFVMARFAKSSEFTVLRMSGLGPIHALETLLFLGIFFAAVTFFVGDYVAPKASMSYQIVKANFEGSTSLGKTSSWLKEKTPNANYAVNVGSLTPNNTMSDISIYKFHPSGDLEAIINSKKATFSPQQNQWLLSDGHQISFITKDGNKEELKKSSFVTKVWFSNINSAMISAAVLRPDRMSTIALFTYMRHLKNNGQSAQRYEIQFWKKFFYPLSCIVMVVLSLPFAYLHFRSENIATYVFIGILSGISFVLLNNVTNDLGSIHNWTPWLAAALPSLIYSFFSLVAFMWLVLTQ
jgi:lipopolysaccharide export system permease protein